MRIFENLSIPEVDGISRLKTLTKYAKRSLKYSGHFAQTQSQEQNFLIWHFTC